MSAYLAAFEHWIEEQRAAGRLSRDSSVEVYRTMWGSLIAWSASLTPPIPLTLLQTNDLVVFHASLSGKGPDLTLSPRYTRRLLGLIDRVLRHRAIHTGEEANEAAHHAIHSQPEVRYAESGDSTPLPEALDAVEAKRLIAFLSTARPRLGAMKVDLPWQQIRNRVSVALQLGAGLSPGDVRAASLDGVAVEGGLVANRPWKIRLPGNGNSPARETPIAPWAGELLQHWLHVRAEQAIPGTWLFPSTRTGKPWGKVAQYGASKQVLADAGLDETQGGSYRLRHTFALRQLKRGADLQQVARWLGVSDLGKMRRYERLLTSSQDVV